MRLLAVANKQLIGSQWKKMGVLDQTEWNMI
jgi:hypothetical protein